jgi:DnaK suppressor protein
MKDDATRHAELREMLSSRQRDLQSDLQSRIRGVRTDRENEVRDELEDSDARSHRDIELALLQIKMETMARVEEALVRLDAGEYGRCFACAAEISATRLRALPFAVRCTKCEERREHGQRKENQLAQSRRGISLFPDQANS